MDFLEIAKRRNSCRKYSEESITLKMLLSLVEAARIAPSAVNYQPWHFILITNNAEVIRLSEAYDRQWFKLAPAAIVICANHNTSWKRADGKDHADIDIAIATDHITLKATEMGLGTCWVCNFDVATCKNILQLPDYMEPIVILPIGIPAENSDSERHNTLRKKTEEIVSIGVFGKSI